MSSSAKLRQKVRPGKKLPRPTIFLTSARRRPISMIPRTVRRAYARFRVVSTNGALGYNI
jgi:hypothetical protein